MLPPKRDLSRSNAQFQVGGAFALLTQRELIVADRSAKRPQAPIATTTSTALASSSNPTDASHGL